MNCSDCGHPTHPPGKCPESVEVPVCCNCPEVNEYGELFCCGHVVPEMMACYCGMENRINSAYQEEI